MSKKKILFKLIQYLQRANFLVNPIHKWLLKPYHGKGTTLGAVARKNLEALNIQLKGKALAPQAKLN